MEVTGILAGTMLQQAGKAASVGEGTELMHRLIADGSAWQKFLGIVRAQEGDPAVLEDPEKYPAPKSSHAITADRSGWIGGIDALETGLTAVALGAGRMKTSDEIDPGAGIRFEVKTGEKVERGQPLARIYTNRSDTLAAAAERLAEAIQITEEPSLPQPVILATMDRSDLPPV
jgi:pyrimidine-nucleoside phosphorylase